jgi:hypothetical protein
MNEVRNNININKKSVTRLLTYNLFMRPPGIKTN